MFFYIALPLVFVVGLLVGRRTVMRASAEQDVPQDTIEERDDPSEALLGDRVDNEITKDLQTTRSALADLLQSFEDCESKLAEPFEVGELRSELGALSLSIQSMEEMLAVSYDHLRKAPVGALSVESRDQLQDWLTRRLALLNRYGNSFSVAVVQFSGDFTDSEEQVHDLTQVLRDFVRDTDRLFVYSENEFVVALPETLMEDACQFAVRCRETMREQFDLDARLGITEAFADDNARTVLNRADAALHHGLADPKDPLFYHDGSALRPISIDSVREKLALLS